jgi:hypothetical protein
MISVNKGMNGSDPERRWKGGESDDGELGRMAFL